MSQPTDLIVISDITTVTGVADVVIDGTVLWASPGLTPAGRYWTLWTTEHVLAGVVVEHGGQFDAVIGTTPVPAATAQDAAVAIVAALHAAPPKGAE